MIKVRIFAETKIEILRRRRLRFYVDKDLYFEETKIEILRCNRLVFRQIDISICCDED